MLYSCFGAVFHGFITALMVHTQQPISRGSLGVHGLGMLPLLNVLLHDLLAALSRLCRGFKGGEVKRRFTVVRPLFDSVFERQKRGILAAFSPLGFNSACLFSVCSKQSIFLIIPPFSVKLVENAASANLRKKAIPCVMYEVAKPRLRNRSLQV